MHNIGLTRVTWNFNLIWYDGNGKVNDVDTGNVIHNQDDKP